MDQPSVLIIAGSDKKYDLDLTIKIGRSGPEIEADETEINFNEDSVSYLNSEIGIINSSTLIFYKFEGKYIILSGRNQLDVIRQGKKFKGKYIGRLISKPMLKKCIIDDSIENIVDVAGKSVTNRFDSVIGREQRPRF